LIYKIYQSHESGWTSAQQLRQNNVRHPAERRAQQSPEFLRAPSSCGKQSWENSWTMGLQRASVDSVNMGYTRNMGVVNITGVAMPKARSATRAPRPYHHGDLRRGLIDAALALVAEKQDWTFSLREVARRAGVSHNAPYNHFTDRGELLGAVAAAGFERLRERMLAAIADIDSAPAALAAGARAYVGSGLPPDVRPRPRDRRQPPAGGRPRGRRPGKNRTAGDPPSRRPLRRLCDRSRTQE
jgi:AcrR family transcriptional regulator